MNNSVEKSILEALGGEEQNYLLPFFWQHGEEESVLREEIASIYDSGIRAFCVEARPHPDFCGDGWWHDMDIILDEAKKRGMKVWILDDAHFPTGYANGALAKGNEDKSKQYLKMVEKLVSGPTPNATFPVGKLINPPPMPSFGGGAMWDSSDGLLKPELPADDFLLAAVACPIESPSGKLGAPIRLDEFIRDGVLDWDVPAGAWRVLFFIVTRSGGGRSSYLSWVDADSARLQIEAVYEPHYAHYASEFGGTIAGFFSDEPCIDNTTGFNFDESIGRSDMQLPYSKELAEMLAKTLGENWLCDLPSLWRDGLDEARTAEVRRAYMDALTTLVERNFSRAIGYWCEARGVEYIGHLIEDENQHSRLGSSLGHFFRGLRGQHMSGIDDIGGQVLFAGGSGTRPGMIGPPRDSEFYHFALGKLGSSFGHIDPRKQGRTMCEIFGAYGWGEGTRLMKYLADHFLVRGVNYFVPHAFSPKFPDPDCPPHFYARGENPLYRPFGLLSRYMNRVCHVLSGGEHRCRAAILYHGESEWMGDAMLMQKPARELAEHQIDFDFLPSDLFDESHGYPHSFDGALHASGERYDCLVFPGADYLPYHAARFAADASEKGFPVYVVGKMPRGVLGGSDAQNASAHEKLLANATPIELADLAETLAAQGFAEVALDHSFADLRVYHYEKSQHIYMLSNESAGEVFSGKVFFPQHGEPVLYDAFENRLLPADFASVDGGVSVELTLEPYESIIVCFCEKAPILPKNPTLHGEKVTLCGDWTVAYSTAKTYPTFTDAEVIGEPKNLTTHKPGFSGIARYELTIELENPHDYAVLELPEAFEFAEVFINGDRVGSRIAPPYRFDCSGKLVAGANRIAIEVTNTLANQMASVPSIYDFFGPSFADPAGLIGYPVLKF